MGGYPRVAISGNTTRSAPSSSARPMQEMILSRLPAMSAMVGFIWAIAIFMLRVSTGLNVSTRPIFINSYFSRKAFRFLE